MICERKESPAHFGIALLPKKGVAKSVRALDILLERGLVNPNGKTEVRNAGHNGDTQQANGQFRRCIINQN